MPVISIAVCDPFKAVQGKDQKSEVQYNTIRYNLFPPEEVSQFSYIHL